jgi:hypothetical protein
MMMRLRQLALCPAAHQSHESGRENGSVLLQGVDVGEDMPQNARGFAANLIREEKGDADEWHEDRA